MAYKVERARAVDRDLEAIFDFLCESYVAFGEERQEALTRAAKRVEAIERQMLSLGRAPHQGTLRPDLMGGLRCVTKQRAIYYFDVNDGERIVRVLAVFFGGQDHQRAMLRRVLGPD